MQGLKRGALRVSMHANKGWIGTAMLLAAATAGAAADWSQWRGAERDGRATGFTAPAAWPKEPKRAWKVPVGLGHSSPVVLAERVFVFTREGDDEVLAAHELKTGKPIWQQRYAAPYQMNSAATSHGPGPKSTPLVSGNQVCAFGISGKLSCHDAATGRLLWRKDFAGQYRATSPLYGSAASPLLADGMLIAAVGGPDDGALIAFDAATGAIKWTMKGDGPAYASPVVTTLDGVRQVVTQTQTRVVGVDLAKGTLLWSIPFTTAYDQNAVTPLINGPLVIYSGMGTSLRAVRPARKDGAWKVETVWDAPDFPLYMSSPVLAANRLVGFTHKKKGQLFALDPATGRVAWASEGRLGENAALVAAGGAMLALLDDAHLVVFDPAAAAYTPRATYSVADSPTWAHPVPTPAGLLVKDANTLALWRFDQGDAR